MTKKDLPIIGITMGDPTGVGPEVIVKVLSSKSTFRFCRPVVLGDKKVMQRAIKLLGSTLKINETERKMVQRVYISIYISSYLYANRCIFRSVAMSKPERTPIAAYTVLPSHPWCNASKVRELESYTAEQTRLIKLAKKAEAKNKCKCRHCGKMTDIQVER